MIIIDDFLIRAALGGIGIALVAGPLGAFVVWQRMAYFGAALSHAALLGVALSFFLDINLKFGIISISILFSLLAATLQKNMSYSRDTILGIIAHGSLAVGLILASFMQEMRIDLTAYLFGDILTITATDIIMIYSGVAVTLITILLLWRKLLICTIHKDWARAQHINPDTIQLIFMLLLSLVIALSIKIVGILLIVSLLIIPAAIARRFSETPEDMALLSIAFGGLSVIGGLFASFQWDTPAGASIVTTATLLFTLSLLKPQQQ